MTVGQSLAFAILLGTIALFAWDKLRYDLVAMLSLCTGLVTGIVPPDKAFHGFSDPVVVVVAAALVVSAGIERSGIVERLARPLARFKSPDRLIGTLSALVMGLSALMKNIGALAIFIPLALRLARANNIPASQVLMPLSFASLVGGLMTLIGTSPNIIVSRVREDLTGTPHTMFDFTPVGLGVCLCAITFLTFAWRVLPRDRQGATSAETRFRIEDYLAEVRILPQSPLIGATVVDLEQLFSGGAVTVATIIRDQGHRYVPGGNWEFSENDILVVEGDPAAIKPLLETAGLAMIDGGHDLADADLTVIEAVVKPSSPLVGTTMIENALGREHGIAVLAISRGDRHLVERLRQIEFMAGDVLVVEGANDSLPKTLSRLGCLPGPAQHPFHQPYAHGSAGGHRHRRHGPGSARRIAGGAGVLSCRRGDGAVALLAIARRLRGDPLADHHPARRLDPDQRRPQEHRRLGSARRLAGRRRVTRAGAAALGLVLPASMLLAPFLHHAATVLLMGPVAAGMAVKLGLAIDPFLMAVATGAACDFLHPHRPSVQHPGHGGRRLPFRRLLAYWLGLPLSVIVVLSGTTLVLLAWPIHGG